jgi:hypothetical protein
MKQEELQELVNTKINLGMTYQEIYDELNTAIPGREIDIAAIIAELPSMRQRKLFAPWRMTVMIAIVAAVALQIPAAIIAYKEYGGLLFLLSVMAPAFYGFMLFDIWGWRTTSYKVIGYLSLVLIALWVWVDYDLLHILQTVVYGLIGFLGIYLETQLGGKYTKVFRGHKEGAEGRLAVYDIRFKNE